jgi:hypothetical protein
MLAHADVGDEIDGESAAGAISRYKRASPEP